MKVQNRKCSVKKSSWILVAFFQKCIQTTYILHLVNCYIYKHFTSQTNTSCNMFFILLTFHKNLLSISLDNLGQHICIRKSSMYFIHLVYRYKQIFKIYVAFAQNNYLLLKIRFDRCSIHTMYIHLLYCILVKCYRKFHANRDLILTSDSHIRKQSFVTNVIFIELYSPIQLIIVYFLHWSL